MNNEVGLPSTRSVADLLLKVDPIQRSVYREVELLVEQILCQPVSVAQAQHSISVVGRLKTWLGSTMSQSRLSHMAVCS